MTQTIQHIRLDEIGVLRIICQDKKCGATIEIPLKKASYGIRSVRCPGCSAELHHGMNETEDPFRDLAKALLELSGFTSYFRVELPVKPDDAE